MRPWVCHQFAVRFSGILTVSLGLLLRNKLKDAQDKISEHKASIQHIQSDPRYTDEFFKDLLHAERAYLAGTNTVTVPDLQEELEHEYLKSLDLWHKATSAGALLSFILELTSIIS